MNAPPGSLRAGASMRALLICVFILIVTVLGAIVGLAARARQDWMANFGTAFLILGITALILGFALLLLALPAAVRFIRCGLHHFASFARTARPTAVLLFIGAAALAGVTRRGDPPGPSAQPIPLGIVFGQRSIHDSIFIPFFPVEGKSPECNENANFGTAAQLANEQLRAVLVDLSRSLGACTDGTRQITIDVRGFASTSDFRSCINTETGEIDKKRSEQLNWRLAEARRQTIIGVVQTSDPQHRILIKPGAETNRWSSAEEMRSFLQFSDKDAQGKYDPLKGGLTRRSEIVILDKGSCAAQDV